MTIAMAIEFNLETTFLAARRVHIQESRNRTYAIKISKSSPFHRNAGQEFGKKKPLKIAM